MTFELHYLNTLIIYGLIVYFIILFISYSFIKMTDINKIENSNLSRRYKSRKTIWAK